MVRGEIVGSEPRDNILLLLSNLMFLYTRTFHVLVMVVPSRPCHAAYMAVGCFVVVVGRGQLTGEDNPVRFQAFGQMCADSGRISGGLVVLVASLRWFVAVQFVFHPRKKDMRSTPWFVVTLQPLYFYR
ncbi:hypothetical protein SESBI_37080 [Sesbania bispinosa]|nr:hypothetical protein SESBI_37080 [Sesbania bispinosa]